MLSPTQEKVRARLNKILIADAYKLSHGLMYPKNTTNLFSTLTARNSYNNQFKSFDWNEEGIERIIIPIINDWAVAVANLGSVELRALENHLTTRMSSRVAKGFEKQLRELHIFLTDRTSSWNLKNFYKALPIKIRIAQSNPYMEFQKPLITITGTKDMEPRFIWLINFFETVILQNIWQYVTSSTIARDAREICKSFQLYTDIDNDGFVDYQCHDFSMRGMSSLETSRLSSKGHLNWFKGSDAILIDNEAHSVPATEHSVMIALGKEREEEVYHNLLETFPDGTLSIVIDSWNIWNVLENILPKLKDKILARDGKIVVRPDSGTPIDIICGTKEQKGVLDYLWNTFGGTTNSQGYRVLNPKVGLIYGDGISLESMGQILLRMKDDRYASTNIIFGLGAFTYQYNTRDTLGFAMKATAIQFDNKEWVDLLKDPITDKKKKSLTGRFNI